MGLNTAYIKDCIGSKFDIKVYRGLLEIMLDSVELYETESEEVDAKGIEEFTHLGIYTDKEGNEISLLVVKTEENIDRNRYLVRNFINKKMGVDCENALVAIYSDKDSRWKLSLVIAEKYELDEDNEGTLVFRPTKAYSYTLGKGEALVTVLERLERLEVISNPSLSMLEDTFSVQALDDKFFKEYRDKHYQLVNILEGSSEFMEEAEEGGFTADEFSKKLMSQIVFLYFVQKKGYLGIGETGGNVNFIRELFNTAKNKGDNFFNEYLEPMFTEALNTKRDGSNYYERLDCTVPFLNGGLFEEVKGYSSADSNITISNEYFSNSNGTGLLDIFDRYNFTVSEDDGNENEVAVNPEMLGKVFEALLDTLSAKKNGVVYTPKQIVQYMCKESLIQYLSNKTPIDKKVIETLILCGDKIIHENNENLTEDYINAKNLLRDASDIIVDTLYDVKVAEPSVGSGAFLVGMLQEIVGTIELLNDYRKHKESTYDIKLNVIKNCLYAVDIEPTAVEITKLRLWLSLLVDSEDKEIKPLPNLEFKIMCGNSIVNKFMGITIDDRKIREQYVEVGREMNKMSPGSPYRSEIAKAKTDLKEMVDGFDKAIKEKDKLFKTFNHKEKEEKINEINNLRLEAFKNLAKIKNRQELDRHRENVMKILKIPTTKLASVINILNEVVTSDSPDDVANKVNELVSLGAGGDINKVVTPIYTLISEYKSDEEIDKISDLYREKVVGRNTEFFMWGNEFSEVFTEDRGGFDIFIGNPPYVSSTNTDANLKEMLTDRFSTYNKKADLMIAFMELGFEELLRDKGVLSFITSNKWLRAGYGEAFRKYLVDNVDVINLIDFKGTKIFENAGVDTCILIGTKEKEEQEWGYTDGSNWK